MSEKSDRLKANLTEVIRVYHAETKEFVAKQEKGFDAGKHITREIVDVAINMEESARIFMEIFGETLDIVYTGLRVVDREGDNKNAH